MTAPAERLEIGLSCMPTAVLLMLARVSSRLRPLVTYPGWEFGAAEVNPTWPVRLRLAMWRICNRRRVSRPIRVRWHHGHRVHLHLGNDLSRQLFVAGCIEPNEFCLLDRVVSPGMVFIDVGANDGLYTLFAAAKVGDSGVVIAFEPSSREFDRLQANLILNRLGFVQPVRIGLARQHGHGRLRIAGYGHEGHNTLGEFVYDSVDRERFEDVELTTLDSFLTGRKLKRVDVIKLDVEGAEMSVLEGAVQTLSESRPLLLLELLDPALRRQGHSAAEVVEFLLDLGYEIYNFSSSTGLPVRADPGSEYSENVVAAHRDRQGWDLC